MFTCCLPYIHYNKMSCHGQPYLLFIVIVVIMEHWTFQLGLLQPLACNEHLSYICHTVLFIIPIVNVFTVILVVYSNEVCVMCRAITTLNCLWFSVCNRFAELNPTKFCCGNRVTRQWSQTFCNVIWVFASCFN